MRIETVTKFKDLGGNWKPDPETEEVVEIPTEDAVKFIEMQKAFGKRVYEDEKKYWTVFQKSWDEISVSTYWKE